MRILFIQQHLPKVLMGWWHTQHLYQLTGGGLVAWIHFCFPWTKGQIQPVCVSSCRDVPWVWNSCFPGPLGPCSVPVQHPSSSDCSTFTLSTDVLFLQQMHCSPGQITYWSRCWFLFFKAKCMHCGALDRREEGLPPYTHSPSPADGCAGICPTSLCQGLCFLTRLLSIVPAHVRGATHPNVWRKCEILT